MTHASPAIPALRADDVWKSFGAREVLRGVSVSLRAHDVVALIGASGSGKSTLLRCLGLLEPIDDGEIWFDGRRMNGLQPDRVCKLVGRRTRRAWHVSKLQVESLAHPIRFPTFGIWTIFRRLHMGIRGWILEVSRAGPIPRSMWSRRMPS
mgnify:CR=1 FL=1